MFRQDLALGRHTYGQFRFEEKIHSDVWSFLSVGITTNPDTGEEFVIPDQEYEIFRFLRNYVTGAKYTATLFSQDWQRESRGEMWVPLMFNKYQNCVSALIINKETNGKILILPQIQDKGGAVIELLQGVLPGLSPHLFPHVEGVRWVERNEYELESVLELRNQKSKPKNHTSNRSNTWMSE